ncbi:MAG: alanine dehydrogenase, partial [Anaerolineae bacterium]|nr:alanine dehydrogenase [Anaerolineae bacterium]
DVFQQDVVVVLRSPELKELELLRRGSTLVSMLHFSTRPKRVQRLKELGINAIALDGIASKTGIRLVQNMRAVAWNGLETAFDIFEKKWPKLRKPDGEPIRVLVLGTGMVGKHAVEAASKFGSPSRNKMILEAGNAGVIVSALGRSTTSNIETMKKLFSQTDILVDTTQRQDTSKPVVPNNWLAWLPSHAIIVDLSVDPYTLDVIPPVVRAVEGIPQGNLDQYIFYPDDVNWNAKIPAEIATDVRRTSISCYSWPGIYPRMCMRHYAGQLHPLMSVLLAKGYEDLSLDGGYFEQALVRGSLDYFLAE